MGLASNRTMWRQSVRGRVVPAGQLRAQMVRSGDLRNEIGFQNDINVLLAALDDGAAVWDLAAPLLTADQIGPAYDDGPVTQTDLKATQECPVDPSLLDTYAAA